MLRNAGVGDSSGYLLPSILEQKMAQKETGTIVGRGSLEAERLELTRKKEGSICRELRIKGGPSSY